MKTRLLFLFLTTALYHPVMGQTSADSLRKVYLAAGIDLSKAIQAGEITQQQGTYFFTADNTAIPLLTLLRQDSLDVRHADAEIIFAQLRYTLHLRWLNISGADLKNGGQITNLRPLAHLTALEYLDIHDNQVTDLTPLRSLSRLRYLDARQNNLPGLTGLEQLYLLEVLRTGYGGGSMAVNDLRPLKKLLQLHTLELTDCHITDITPLLALKQLRHLDLSRNRISGKIRMDGFTEMQTMNLSYNKITILDITLMPKLTELQITDNQLMALPPLSAIPAIREIYAGFNNITQVSCSQQTENLAIISLKHNKLQHLGFLQYTPALKQIDVSSNRISDLRPLLHLKDARISCRQNPADTTLLQDHEQKQLGLRP